MDVLEALGSREQLKRAITRRQLLRGAGAAAIAAAACAAACAPAAPPAPTAPAAKAPAAPAAKAPAPATPIEMRFYFQSVPGTSFEKVACVGLPDRIAKATDGRVKVVSMSDLVKPADAFNALKDRRVDAIWFVALYYTSTTPWVGIGAVPGFWESEEQYDRVQRETGFMKRLGEWTLSTYGGRTFASTYTLSQVMFSKKPLSKIEDFNGFKMRTATAEQAQLMTELKAKPTTVAWTELYMGLQTGVVDGAITGLDSGYGSSFYEVVKNVADWPSYRILNPRYFVVNEEYWKALPDDVRTSIEKEINQLSQDQVKGLKDEYNEVVKKFRDKGTAVTLVDDKTEAEKGKPAALKVGNAWIERAKQKGYQFPPDLVTYLKGKGYTIS